MQNITSEELVVQDLEGSTKLVAEELLDYIPPSWTTVEARQPGGKLRVVIHAIAIVLAQLRDIVNSMRMQFRLSSATGNHLDVIARDFFGSVDSTEFAVPTIIRQITNGIVESDDSFRLRIRTELLAPKVTPKGIIEAVQRFTSTPTVPGVVGFFEPFNAASAVCWTGPFNGIAVSNFPSLGLGCYGSQSLNQFYPATRNDGSTPGSTNPNVGVGAMGDAEAKFTFILNIGNNPAQRTRVQIIEVVNRLKAAGVRAIINGGL